MINSIAILIPGPASPVNREALSIKLALAGGQSTLVTTDEQTLFLPGGSWYFRDVASNEALAETIDGLTSDESGASASFLIVNFDACHFMRSRSLVAAAPKGPATLTAQI